MDRPEVMPPLLHMGPAAPCGLARYESAAFGKAYQDNLFACYFNLHKVGRHVLTPSGSTFSTQDEDFVTSPDLDFHPTDVLEDADGSLIVVDTGGWYKLCCPTSQLQKPDVLGAIYRVSRQGVPRESRSLGTHRSREAENPRCGRGGGANSSGFWATLVRPCSTSRSSPSPIQVEWTPLSLLCGRLSQPIRRSHARRNAVWTLTRIDGPAAREIVRSLLADPDETVRQAAIHSAGLWRDRAAVPQLVNLLEVHSLHNRRAAAEALGRIGEKTAVPALLAACKPAG